MPDPILASAIPEEASPTRPLAVVVNDPDGTPAVKLVDLDGQYLTSATAATTYAPIYPYRLWLPGTSGNYVSTPDAADLDLAGDMEVVFKLSAPDWTPATARIVAARRTSGGGLAWQIGLGTDGRFTFSLRTGAADYFVNASIDATAVFVDGSTYWARLRRASASGAVTFWYAATQSAEPTSWTSIAVTGTQTAGVIDAGTQPLEIGSSLAGTGSSPWIGTFDRFILRSGFGGTTVADYDSSIPAVRYYGSDGKVYTVNGSGSAWAIA